MLKDVRQQRSLILLLTITDSDILNHSKSTDDEIIIFIDLAIEKLHRQRILKEYIASSLLDEQFSN